MTTSRPSVGAAALVPLRLFLGATFVYAGLDKILDQRFLDAASPTSIQSQFAIFERTSPLAPLVQLAEPLAVPLGVLIALGEIAVGLGALTRLAYRLSALGGFFFGVMFFLTASWTTHPFYFGPDLPYAVGWLTLGLAGHGDFFVLRLATRTVASEVGRKDSRRRFVLQIGSLAVISLGLASIGGIGRLFEAPLPALEGDDPATPSLGASSPPPSASPSESPSAPPSAAPGIAIATISDVNARGSRRFTVPIAAPPPLPAGDPALVVGLDDGSFAAFDALCTHAGCRVGWDPLTGTIVCPCHGAQFDAADHGAVLAGPTDIPLTELPLVVNVQDGTIALRTA